MGLVTYRRKRDFRRTSEPRGKKTCAHSSSGGLSFVIQKHDATRLHYDFRLELDGVLKSWAVPKGPSMDPAEKRLAVETEDHPLEYGSFEGVIPEGEYGAGPVVVWDRGRWIPEGDPHQAYEKGHLTFELVGSKLRGGWHLVRTRMGKKPSWRLFKRNDETAERGSGSKVVDEEPASVISGRTIALPAAMPALRSVRLTHPDRVLFRSIHATKADLALYYAQVAPRMLPHVANRPLMLVRCPNGQDQPCFHQKHPTPGIARSIKIIDIREKTGTFETMYVEDAEGLVELLQNGALEIHTWGSRVDDVERADQITFDLDPDEGLPWTRTIEAAQTIRSRLTALDLPCFLKTTGGKGLHIVIPITPELEWDDLKGVCRTFADSMVRREPNKYLATISKARRKGKILIDYLRNGRGATAVCAYSTRARPNAPVSTPIDWKELTPDLRPDQLTIHEVPGRVATMKDPWREFGDRRPKLTAAVRRGLAK